MSDSSVWSKEPPTEPGWWWVWRVDHAEPVHLFPHSEGEGLMLWDCQPPIPLSAVTLAGVLWGPRIPAPPLPEPQP
ncbi:MAG: hypothetical protein ACQGVC_18075 [Myxococcota bacterium]